MTDADARSGSSKRLFGWFGRRRGLFGGEEPGRWLQQGKAPSFLTPAALDANSARGAEEGTANVSRAFWRGRRLQFRRADQ
ncbi:hypothetical protein A1351_19675 [Methylosinus sp. R-45379]|nr:hypothetical protein A1351_19675 [Methylosinus sp. R-45379]